MVMAMVMMGVVLLLLLLLLLWRLGLVPRGRGRGRGRGRRRGQGVVVLVGEVWRAVVVTVQDVYGGRGVVQDREATRGRTYTYVSSTATHSTAASAKLPRDVRKGQRTSVHQSLVVVVVRSKQQGIVVFGDRLVPEDDGLNHVQLVFVLLQAGTRA